MLQCAAFCGSGLRCVLQVCCSSALWRVSVLLHCSVLQVLKGVAVCWSSSKRVAPCCSVGSVLQLCAPKSASTTASCDSGMQCVEVRGSVLHFFAVCCSACSALQCVTVRCSALKSCHKCKWVMSNHTYEWLTSHLKVLKIRCHQGQICQREMMDETHCNILQHTATHECRCFTFRIDDRSLLHVQMQHTATHCNTLQRSAMHCNRWMLTGYLQEWRWHRPLICVCMQHTATHCNTLQHTATHCNTLHHTATHCYTRLHTATHCNTLLK